MTGEEETLIQTKEEQYDIPNTLTLRDLPDKTLFRLTYTGLKGPKSYFLYEESAMTSKLCAGDFILQSLQCSPVRPSALHRRGPAGIDVPNQIFNSIPVQYLCEVHSWSEHRVVMAGWPFCGSGMSQDLMPH